MEVLAEGSLGEGVEGVASQGGQRSLPPSIAAPSPSNLQEPPGFCARASFVAQGTKPVMGEDKRWTTEMKAQLFGFFRAWGEEDSCFLQQLPTILLLTHLSELGL